MITSVETFVFAWIGGNAVAADLVAGCVCFVVVIISRLLLPQERIFNSFFVGLSILGLTVLLISILRWESLYSVLQGVDAQTTDSLRPSFLFLLAFVFSTGAWLREV